MRFLKKTLSQLAWVTVAVVEAACAPPTHPAAFAVHSAVLDHGSLNAQLDWHPTALMLDALDHGIPLDFELTLEAVGEAHLGWHPRLGKMQWRRELRYFPLTRQYQLRDPRVDKAHDSETRNYPARALLIAAMSDLRLSVDADWLGSSAPALVRSYILRIDLQRDNLPGALRLPALIDDDWRLSTGNYTWVATPNAG